MKKLPLISQLIVSAAASTAAVAIATTVTDTFRTAELSSLEIESGLKSVNQVLKDEIGENGEDTLKYGAFSDMQAVLMTRARSIGLVGYADEKLDDETMRKTGGERPTLNPEVIAAKQVAAKGLNSGHAEAS